MSWNINRWADKKKKQTITDIDISENLTYALYTYTPTPTPTTNHKHTPVLSLLLSYLLASSLILCIIFLSPLLTFHLFLA